MSYPDGLYRRYFTALEQLAMRLDGMKKKTQSNVYAVLVSVEVKYKKHNGKIIIKQQWSIDKSIKKKLFDRKVNELLERINLKIKEWEKIKDTHAITNDTSIDLVKLLKLRWNKPPKQIMDLYFEVINKYFADIYDIEESKSMKNRSDWSRTLTLTPKTETAKVKKHKKTRRSWYIRWQDKRKEKSTRAYVQKMLAEVNNLLWGIEYGKLWKKEISSWKDLWLNDSYAPHLRKNLLWLWLLHKYYENKETDKNKDYIFLSKEWITNEEYVKLIYEESVMNEEWWKNACGKIIKVIPDIRNQVTGKHNGKSRGEILVQTMKKNTTPDDKWE